MCKERQTSFSNILFNAVRYTPAQALIRVRWEESATGAVFSVTDTGIGIEAHHLSQLTLRFYRVDPARTREVAQGGTGLGLAIVKHVILRHAGCLNIERTPDIGSCFSCHFFRGRGIRAHQQVSFLADSPLLRTRYLRR